MSYQMRLNSRSRVAGRFIGAAHDELRAAFEKSGKTQQEIADRLGVDKAVINRRLKGTENLTLRTLAEMAWAINHDVRVVMVRPKSGVHRNERDRWLEPALVTARGGTTPVTTSQGASFFVSRQPAEAE